MEFPPRGRILNNGKAALSRNALGRLLTGGVFQTLGNGAEFRVIPFAQRKEIARQRRLVNAVLFAGPALDSFELGDSEMGAVDIKTSVRAMHLQRVGMHPVHHDVDVQIGCILVDGIERLMFLPLHEL